MRTAAIALLGALLPVLCLPKPAAAQPDASFAIAAPLRGITIDGSLDDWPKGMERHPILHHGQAYGPTDIDTADLTSSPDLTASFMVGYSPSENLLYLAVTMRDDSLTNGRPLSATDGCEIYLEGTRQRKVSGMNSYLPEVAAAIQYVLCPPGGSYDADTPGRPPSQSFRMFMGDIAKTRTRAAFSRKGDISVFEWAVELYDRFPDTPTRLIPGRTIGVDVVVNDVDGPDPAAWVCWGTYKPFKFVNGDTLGDILLVDDPSKVGAVSGQITNPRDQKPFGNFEFELYRGKDLMGTGKADAGGKIRMTLAAGKYTLRPKARQGVETGTAATITVKAGRESSVAVTPKPVKLPTALVRASETYRLLEGYRDSTIITMQMNNPDDERNIVLPYTVSFARPNRLKLECGINTGADNFSYYSDGKQLTLLTHSKKLYFTNPAPESFELTDFFRTIMQDAGNMLDLAFLFAENPIDMLTKNTESVRETGRETLEGERVSVVEIVRIVTASTAQRSPDSMFMTRLSGSDTIATRFWIGERDGLIKQAAYRVNMDNLSQGMPEQIRSLFRGSVEFTIRHRSIELNPVFGADAFVFTPPEGVSEIRISTQPAVSAAPVERKLDGKPAPEFMLRDVQGKEQWLVNFKGKVVLLDFWASWNDASVETLRLVQGIHEKFKDRGVVVLGVNTLEEESPEGVKQFLDERKITCPVLLDPDNTMSEKYSFKKIPVCFLIDKKGTIRGSFATMPDGEVLAKVIEKALEE